MPDRTAQQNVQMAKIPAVSSPTISGLGKTNHTVLRPVGPRIQENYRNSDCVWNIGNEWDCKFVNKNI